MADMGPLNERVWREGASGWCRRYERAGTPPLNIRREPQNMTGFFGKKADHVGLPFGFLKHLADDTSSAIDATSLVFSNNLLAAFCPHRLLYYLQPQSHRREGAVLCR